MQNTSNTETSLKSDTDNEVKHIENAFQKLELKRIHKVTPTSLTKNWYHTPTPPDI
jgi:hypothetical protein